MQNISLCNITFNSHDKNHNMFIMRTMTKNLGIVVELSVKQMKFHSLSGDTWNLMSNAWWTNPK